MSAALEFLRIAEEAGAAKKRCKENQIQEPLNALRKACEDAARSWSGSNFGHHSTIYYQGLRPKPARVQFSSEWGLMDAWPVHQPDPGWQVMDYEAVSDAIVSRAGKDEVKAAERELEPIREEFDRLKEDAISTFTSLGGKKTDDYLQRQRRAVEECEILSSREIAARFLPRGRLWSRDTLALSQGIQLAPHQSWIALPQSAVVLEQALGTLEKAVRQAASHFERTNPAEGSGAFIAAGRAFDAFKAIGKVLSSAKRDVLIVDPYMDEKVLTDFAQMAPENVALRLLTDEQSRKATLLPAATRWISQWGSSRPLESKIAPPRALHDRLIIVDDRDVWILTQSFNAFAARAPASIVQADVETAPLKIAAYKALWLVAKPLA